MNKIQNLSVQYSPSEIEEEVIKYWKQNQIFEKSVDQKDPTKSYRFYDGPPFVTGTPHYGHLLGSIIKDVIPRYQTMKGKRVERVWGWDCHGLPIENKVEQLLGINSKKEIEELGIDRFVAECKKYVNNVSSDWGWYIDKIGRWVDMENAYKTMDTKYMESVIWVFKELYEKGYVYQGKRVSLFCPRCSTPISNFEVAMDNSYKNITDTSIFVKFKEANSDRYFVAWTTTPWTLPSNFALAVSAKDEYVLARHKDSLFYVAKQRLDAVFDDDYQIIESFRGEDLIGKKYEPLYSYYKGGENDHIVYGADFVSMEDGSGIVHIAPGFGEDDTELGKKHNLSSVDSVDDTGHLDPVIIVAEGRYFKAADKYILADLESRSVIIKSTNITHSYPHCHRCSTPLLYKSQLAWYINIQDSKDKLVSSNKDINWVPGHFKDGRFKLGIESAPDWCISRSRYYGTPIPVWECACGEKVVLGSIEEIEKLSNTKITDLHRPVIDEIQIPCPKCANKMKRVPEVLDVWIESASMPYAALHYPFENKEKFLSSFPADFITEYTGQLRAWFYVTHVISNLLMESIAFKNVVVSGVIMGSDHKKMSKSLQNFPDPKESLQKFGGDSLRLYLMGGNITLGQDIFVSEEDWSNEVKQTLMLLWNSYKYFVSYASLEEWKPSKFQETSNVLDQWVMSRLSQTGLEIDTSLNKYEIPKAVSALKSFISDLSTWYIRRSRDRVNPSQEDREDKEQAFNTMYQVFTQLLKVASPIIPFISEYLYRHLTGEESVHLTEFPEFDSVSIDLALIQNMEKVRRICEMGNAERKIKGVPVKQALSSITIIGDFKSVSSNSQLIDLIKDELNLEKVFFRDGDEGVDLDTVITPELRDKGMAREIVRSIQEARKLAGCAFNERISVFLTEWPESQTEEIKKKALVDEIFKGEELKVIRKHNETE